MSQTSSGGRSGVLSPTPPASRAYTSTPGAQLTPSSGSLTSRPATVPAHSTRIRPSTSEASGISSSGFSSTTSFTSSTSSAVPSPSSNVEFTFSDPNTSRMYHSTLPPTPPPVSSARGASQDAGANARQLLLPNQQSHKMKAQLENLRFLIGTKGSAALQAAQNARYHLSARDPTPSFSSTPASTAGMAHLLATQPSHADNHVRGSSAEAAFFDTPRQSPIEDGMTNSDSQYSRMPKEFQNVMGNIVSSVEGLLSPAQILHHAKLVPFGKGKGLGFTADEEEEDIVNLPPTTVAHLAGSSSPTRRPHTSGGESTKHSHNEVQYAYATTTVPTSSRRKYKARLDSIRHKHQVSDSWSTAARTAIPLAYDPSAVVGAVKTHEAVIAIQKHTKKLLQRDALERYKLLHAPDRERREQREKPWREGCAVEAGAQNHVLMREAGDAHLDASMQGYDYTADPLTAASGIPAAGSDASFHAISDMLTSLLQQHQASEVSMRHKRKEERLSALKKRAKEGRKLGRLRGGLEKMGPAAAYILRNFKPTSEADETEEDLDMDEKQANVAQSPLSRRQARKRKKERSRNEDVEDSDEYDSDKDEAADLASLVTDVHDLVNQRPDDPLVRLLVALGDKVNEDTIWSHVVEQLVEPRNNLISKPLRFLLQRVQTHHQSMLQPLRELLDLVGSRLLQEWKVEHLLGANTNSISSVGTLDQQRIAKATAEAGVGSMSNAPALPPQNNALNALLDQRSVLASSLTSTSTTLRIHALQRAHLQRLQEELHQEWRRSIDASQALEDTKSGLSAKVNQKMFKQAYTKLVRKKAAELASDGSKTKGGGAGSSYGQTRADAEHRDRHLYDYDLVAHSLSATDLVTKDAQGHMVPKRYLEDEMSHAIEEDEETSPGPTTKMLVVSKGTATLNGRDVTKQVAKDVSNEAKQARHMASMRRFLASFERERLLPAGSSLLPIEVATPSAILPSLDTRCNTAVDFRQLRDELKKQGVISFIQRQIEFGWFTPPSSPSRATTDINSIQASVTDASFNFYTRIIAGRTKLPDYCAREQLSQFGFDGFVRLKYYLLRNDPETEEAWDSAGERWLGKASMGRNHRILLLRDLDWSHFNVLTLGLHSSGNQARTTSGVVPRLQDKGKIVADLTNAIELLDHMESIARTFTSRSQWSNDIGLFFHAYPFATSNGLQLHIVDLACVGPSFYQLDYKNLSLYDVRQVLMDELGEIDSRAASSIREKNSLSLAPAIQSLTTRPVLRIHTLSNGDMLSGQVAYQSYYYLFKLSATENGAWIRLIQHPSDLHQQYGDKRSGHAYQALLRGRKDDPRRQPRASPSAAEDDFNYVDIYLNPGAPPTRTRHTHKATTRGAGICSLDLRPGLEKVQNNGGEGSFTPANAKTLSELMATSAAPNSLVNRSTEWFVRIVGRGMRPKGFTLEFRTNTTVLDYSGVFGQLLHDLEEQSEWQESVADKMVAVDQLLAAFIPKSQYPESTEASATGSDAMFPNPAERPPKFEASTQTHIVALHEVDVEASMKRKEIEEEEARLAEERRLEEERRHVISLGGMQRLFVHPLPPRSTLRVWSQNTLLKLILAVYKSKLQYDTDFEQTLIQHTSAINQRSAMREAAAAGSDSSADNSAGSALVSIVPPKKTPFNEFLYNYFKSRYGLVKLAELYAREFIHSIEVKYLALPRVALFSRLVQIFTPVYSSGDVDFFFRALKLLWRWCNLHGIIPQDNEAGRCILPYYVIEDALFEIWSHINEKGKKNQLVQVGTTLVQPLAIAPTAGQPTEEEKEEDFEFTSRIQEVTQTSWCQMLLKKLRPLLLVHETVNENDKQNVFLIRAPRIDKKFLMDSDEAMQVLIDHSSKQLSKSVEELRAIWGRMCTARILAANEDAERRAAASSDATSARTSTARDTTPNEKVGLKLAEFLSFMRVEFAWFDDFELYLLYFECVKAQAAASGTARRSNEDSIHMEAFLRIGLRYEMLNPPVPEGDEELDMGMTVSEEKKKDKSAKATAIKRGVSPIPKSGPSSKKDPKSASTSSSGSPNVAARKLGERSDTPVVPEDSDDSFLKDIQFRSNIRVPASQLHLTTHQLPFPIIVMPGYKEAKKFKDVTVNKSKSIYGNSKTNPQKYLTQLKKEAAQPKWINTSRIVWDELALARVIPEADKRPGVTMQTVLDASKRPKSLCDSSIYLPPSISPPPSLSPVQSLKLLSNLHTLFQPILIDNLNKLQQAWNINSGTGLYSPEEVKLNSTKLARIYELLSEIQMNLDKKHNLPVKKKAPSSNSTKSRLGITGNTASMLAAAEAEKAAKAEAERAVLEAAQDSDADSLYDSGSEDERIAFEDATNPELQKAAGDGAISPAPKTPRMTKADQEQLVLNCWALFRHLFSISTELFLAHSALYKHLSHLKSPDGKAFVSTEFAGGDVNRAFAALRRNSLVVGAVIATPPPADSNNAPQLPLSPKAAHSRHPIK